MIYLSRDYEQVFKNNGFKKDPHGNWNKIKEGRKYRYHFEGDQVHFEREALTPNGNQAWTRLKSYSLPEKS